MRNYKEVETILMTVVRMLGWNPISDRIIGEIVQSSVLWGCDKCRHSPNGIQCLCNAGEFGTIGNLTCERYEKDE